MVNSDRCMTESRAKKSDNVTINQMNQRRVTVTPLDEFLGKPPEGFAVKVLASGYRVQSDPAQSLVLIDDLDCCGRKVFFHNSLGRWEKLKLTHSCSRVLCIKLILATGKWNCGPFGSTPPPGAACCPRGSICWFLLMRKTQKMKPEVDQTYPSTLHPFSELLLYLNVNTQICGCFTELEVKGPDLLLQLVFSHQRKARWHNMDGLHLSCHSVWDSKLTSNFQIPSPKEASLCFQLQAGGD